MDKTAEPLQAPTDGRAMPTRVLLATIVLFYLVGFGLLVFALNSFVEGRHTGAWPTTEGRMAECRFEESPQVGGTPMYEVKVRYNYSVAGRNFEGNRLAVGYSRSSNFASHRAIYDRLQHASRVRVSYDPADPGNSVLEPRTNRGGRFGVLAFAVFWLLLISAYTYSWRVSTRARHSPGTGHQ